MRTKYPILLKPHLEYPIWSGEKIASDWGIESKDKIGEGFFMSTLTNKESIAINGIYAGKSLSFILNENRDFTKSKSSELSLLFKIIDTSDLLSVQVHPNDEYALRIENQLGKTESWLILDANENSYIYMGLNGNYNKEIIANAIKNNTIEKYLNKIYVKKGDYFYIASGTIHALGKNITVAEIQQSSMVTYRLYDYDRRDFQGNARELHIEKSLDVINYNQTKLESIQKSCFKEKENILEIVDKSKYFSVYCANITTNLNIQLDDYCHIMILEGDGFVCCDNEKTKISKGSSLFIPSNLNITLDGNLKIVLNTLG